MCFHLLINLMSISLINPWIIWSIKCQIVKNIHHNFTAQVDIYKCLVWSDQQSQVQGKGAHSHVYFLSVNKSINQQMVSALLWSEVVFRPLVSWCTSELSAVLIRKWFSLLRLLHLIIFKGRIWKEKRKKVERSQIRYFSWVLFLFSFLPLQLSLQPLRFILCSEVTRWI